MVATIPQLRQNTFTISRDNLDETASHLDCRAAFTILMAAESQRGRVDASFGVLQGLPISSYERWSLLLIEGFGAGEGC
jgi:hypothetical protein